MKFTCEKAALLKEISIAQEIISSKNTLSILSNVLLEAADNTLLIRATDLKVGFENRIPVDVAVSGSTTIYCDKFLGILRSLPDGEIEFEDDGSALVIRPLFKKIDFKLKSIAADKFPEILAVDEDLFFEFPQKDFIEMVSQTIFAVSDDETRYYMNGVYMETVNGELIMVATDGRRLSIMRKKYTGPAKEFPGIIVPPKILNLVRRLAPGEGNLSIAVTDKNIFVRFDTQRLSSALIDGQFPNYQRVIPVEQTQLIVLKKNELMEALKRVSLLVEQKSRRIYLNLRNMSMILSSEESDIGIAKEEISCDYSGEEMIIALNYLYLSEPLRVIEEDCLEIRFTEPTKALSLYARDRKDFFHIVMPMQLE